MSEACQIWARSSPGRVGKRWNVEVDVGIVESTDEENTGGEGLSGLERGFGMFDRLIDLSDKKNIEMFYAVQSLDGGMKIELYETQIGDRDDVG